MGEKIGWCEMCEMMVEFVSVCDLTVKKAFKSF